jgi:amino acid transporter
MRSMKLLGVLFLALSAETPASSVFVIVPDVLTQAGTGALISMLFAALIALCMAGVYGELASAFPIAGGEYALVGRTLGPLPGFVVMALNLSNSLLGAAVLALGVADYFSAAVPGLQPIPSALVTLAGVTALGVLNIRTNALVTGLFLAVELGALGLLAALGLMHPLRSPFDLLAHPQVLNGSTLVPAPAAALGLAVAVAIFAYDGYGSAVYFAEEVHDARRQVGRAIVTALLITLLAELIPLTAMLTGAKDIKDLLGQRRVFMSFIESAGGHGVALGLGLAIGLAIINAVIAIMLLSARQIYATGRDGTWGRPADRVLAVVHPRWGSPWIATLIAGAATGGLCFIPLKLLLIATGTSVSIVYAVLCVSLIAGRRTGSTRLTRFRLTGYPVTPILAVIALAGVLWSDWIDPAEGRPGLIASFGVAAVAAVYYLAALKRRGWTPLDPPD